MEEKFKIFISMNLSDLKILIKFQNTAYFFLQKQITPYLFPEKIISSISAIPNDNISENLYKNILSFLNKLEEIRAFNEPIDFFIYGESVEKGWKYFDLMKDVLINFLRNINIELILQAFFTQHEFIIL